MKQWLCCILVAAGFIAGSAAGATTENEQALAALARRYWAAEVQQDWRTVYDLLPPGDRAVGSRDEYATWRKERGLVLFVAAEIGETAVSGDLAWVRVKYEFQLAKYPEVAPRQAEMWDIWRNVDGWRPVAKKEREAWPKLPPSRRPAAEEAALAARSRELWQAQVAQDWKTYYRYLNPEFQARVPLEKYLGAKAKNTYLSPRVEWAEVIGDAGRAKVLVLAKPNDPGVSKMEPESKVVIEKWVKTNGNWYLDVDLPQFTDAGNDPATEKKAK
jgi:hypothetical protein